MTPEHKQEKLRAAMRKILGDGLLGDCRPDDCDDEGCGCQGLSGEEAQQFLQQLRRQPQD